MFKRYNGGGGTLFFLNIPPPYGGGEIVNQFLLEKIKDSYNIITVSREVHGKSSQGRLNLGNILAGIRILLYQGFWILRLRPRAIFVGIPKDYFAFFRMSLLVHLANFTGAKVVGDLHGMGFKFLHGDRDRYYLYTINKFHRMRVLGRKIKADIAATGYRHELRVIDNGIEVPGNFRRTPSQPNKPLRLLYFGAISESKGFGRTVEVFREICRRYPGRVALDIAGEFADSRSRLVFDSLLSESAALGPVQYHDRVLHDAKWSLLSSSALLIHLSDYDGQPLTIIEAMACGVPTIATKVGAIPEMITHEVDGFLVDDYRVDVVRIISGILDGTIDREKIADNAAETYRSRFTVEKYSENIRSLVTF